MLMCVTHQIPRQSTAIIILQFIESDLELDIIIESLLGMYSIQTPLAER